MAHLLLLLYQPLSDLKERAVPFSLVPSPVLELMLEESGNRDAVTEYLRLREIHCRLAQHLVAIKQQTEATIGGIQSVCEVEPNAPPKLPGG